MTARAPEERAVEHAVAAASDALIDAREAAIVAGYGNQFMQAIAEARKAVAAVQGMLK